ncbi:hypothetical protein BH10ACI1_BH10ACI1_13850 [soil metagenome]
MAETLVEEQTEETAKIIETPKERLERFLRENDIKPFSAKDFDFPKDEETQAKIRAEVDEFLEMREQWREEDRKLREVREKSW